MLWRVWGSFDGPTRLIAAVAGTTTGGTTDATLDEVINSRKGLFIGPTCGCAIVP